VTKICEIDPLQDPRWDEFVESHPRASVFHTSRWLRALRLAYGYESSALCTVLPGERLSGALVYCCVKSWLTGRRLVSLPFSDHCEPLVEDREALETLLAYLNNRLRDEHWDYLELRPVTDVASRSRNVERSFSYLLHTVDLSKTKEALFSSFHKDCVQRKIRRAERESLTYESGNTEEILMRFYGLFLRTRRRHHLPPQHHSWFRHLSRTFRDKLQFRVVSQKGQPVASILTLKQGGTITYKYGCSDPSRNNLGGMALLFWRTIEEAKSEGLMRFDLGRSEPQNTGLTNFKEHWASERSELNYCRISDRRSTDWSGWSRPLMEKMVPLMPDWSLVTAGKLLYRHIG